MMPLTPWHYVVVLCHYHHDIYVVLLPLTLLRGRGVRAVWRREERGLGGWLFWGNGMGWPDECRWTAGNDLLLKAICWERESICRLLLFTVYHPSLHDRRCFRIYRHRNYTSQTAIIMMALRSEITDVSMCCSNQFWRRCLLRFVACGMSWRVWVRIIRHIGPKLWGWLWTGSISVDENRGMSITNCNFPYIFFFGVFLKITLFHVR